MLDHRKLVGKIVEIEISEDDDEMIYEQIIVTRIGSISINKNCSILQFVYPVAVDGDYTVGTVDSATAIGREIVIHTIINREGEEYGIDVGGEITKMH